MRRLTIAFSLSSLMCFIGSSQVIAQTITSLQNRTCTPGTTTQITIHGTDLDDSLRLSSLDNSIDAKIVTVGPTRAILEVTLPKDTSLGPQSLWLTTATGAIKQHILLIDDLEPVVDSGNNHSIETAQPLTTRSSVEGVCDASTSDFYRVHAAAGERIAVEIQTQSLRSLMDPVVRLLNADGEALITIDDSSVGPDCRFSFQFTDEGDYWVEVHDSRNAAAGSHYQLRIGDFPIVDQCFPLAIRAGEKSRVEFTGPDGNLVTPRDIELPAACEGSVYVEAKLSDGQSSTWLPIHCSSYPQFIESSSTETLTLPVGISGRFEQTSEIDSYLVRGTKGQTVRVAAKTRSLGSPAVLQMQMFNSAGAKIAETKVTDGDEWSFDTTFPEDGDYRLEVSDLLKRGGPGFSYWIEIAPAGSFAVAFKADAKTAQEFKIEPTHGACELDVDISRFGYDGAIDLSLSNAEAGLNIINPRIPAQAVAARVYLTAAPNWNPSSFTVLQLLATSVDHPEQSVPVNNHALRRLKEPFVLAPISEGELAMSAVATTDLPFALQPSSVVQFARPVRSHTASLTLQRLNPEFKGGVEVLSSSLPAGWSVSSAADKETYNVTLLRNDQVADEPAQLPLNIFGEFAGHGRIAMFDVPVQWIDPIRASMNFREPLFRGGSAKVEVHIQREGNDPQTAMITMENLPSGIAGPKSLAIAADQELIEFELQIAADAALNPDTTIALNISSKYAGQDFTVSSNQTIPVLLESPKHLSVYPSKVVLSDPQGRQQLVVMGNSEQGASRDWTRDAHIASSNPEVAEIRNGVIVPISNGQSEVFVEVGSAREVVPISVSNMGTSRKIEFESEVLVALSKQGCNSGACHGAPSGKGSFRLSLRAFDMQLDQLTLIREDFGRRLNPIEPEQSLLLLKPLMKVSHGGGKQLHKDDPAYKILSDWIAGGASVDPVETPRITKLEVYPSEKQILAVADGGQQLAVTAYFADGRKRDVTHLAAYETSDTSVATVDVNGFVTPHARGEVAILVRMLEHIEAVPLMFIANLKDFRWESPTPANYVDELVNAKLQQLQYLPAEACSDEEFLRRLHLDLLGVLPTVEQTISFLEETGDSKRSKLIDELLQREEYAKFWALKWGDLLKMTSKLVGDEGVYKYHRWVEKSLHDNMPYDEFAKQLLTGSGSTLANPPANFYRTSTDMNECVETISQVFLGARLQCAKCHNHPFERWTQDNYYGLGAFFNRVQRRKTDRPGEMFVYTNYTGSEVTQPRTGKVMAPWLPQVGSIEATDDVDRRIAFADWLIDPSNPYFARIEANRIWSHLFNRGIVDPVDDFRDSNPPSIAPLLDALANDFAESGYDRKQMLRVILNSRTYQASYQTNDFNKEDLKYFSHQEPRLLGAEQLLDAINRTLGIEQQYGSLPAGTLATQLPAPDVAKVEFLKVFGQPERSTVCACERGDDSNLGLAIELFNGPMVHEKLLNENNRFRKALAAGKKVDQVVCDIYLAAVCRSPSDIELKTAMEYCSKNADPVVGIEDLCWALFNSDEFLFQH